MQVFLFYPMQFIWKHLSSTYSIQKKVYKSLNFFQHTSKILKRVKKQALMKNKRMENNNKQMVVATAPINLKMEEIAHHQNYNEEFHSLLNEQQEILNSILSNNLLKINKLNRNDEQTQAEDAANPDLIAIKKKKHLTEDIEEIKAKIKQNEEKLTIFKAAEMIESKCSMEFTIIPYPNWCMEFIDDDIKIRIDDAVKIFIKDSPIINLGSRDKFDINLFLDKLPIKYWAATYRDQRIDEIFMD